MSALLIHPMRKKVKNRILIGLNFNIRVIGRILLQSFLGDFKRDDTKLSCDKKFCLKCLKHDYDEVLLGLPK
jgi:hypothetical protein